MTRKKCKLCDAKTGSYLKKFRKPCNKNGIHMKKWDYVKKADSCMKKEGVEICDEKNRRPSKKVGSNVTPIHKKICVRLPAGFTWPLATIAHAGL